MVHFVFLHFLLLKILDSANPTMLSSPIIPPRSTPPSCLDAASGKGNPRDCVGMAQHILRNRFMGRTAFRISHRSQSSRVPRSPTGWRLTATFSLNRKQTGGSDVAQKINASTCSLFLPSAEEYYMAHDRSTRLSGRRSRNELSQSERGVRTTSTRKYGASRAGS
jgi:hypothetical protein